MSSRWRRENWRCLPTLTAGEVSQVVGCSPRRVRALIAAGELDQVDDLVTVASVVRRFGEPPVSRRCDAPNGSPIPVAQALRDWLATNRVTFSRGYQETARGLIELHLAPFFEDRDFRAIGRDDAARFAQWMADRELSASTTQGALSILRRVAQLLFEDETLPRNRFAKVGRMVRSVARHRSTEIRRAQTFTRDEVERLLAIALECRPWLYPVLVFLASTGTRRGEALGLRWGDVDLERELVTIRRARVRGADVVPKSGRSRMVPIGAAGPLLGGVLESLARTHDPAQCDEFVFRSAQGFPIDERNLSRAWYAVRKRAVASGVRSLRLHDLRHTFASHAIEVGVSIQRVSAWLGHAQIETTLRVYTHCVPSERAARAFLNLGGDSR